MVSGEIICLRMATSISRYFSGPKFQAPRDRTNCCRNLMKLQSQSHNVYDIAHDFSITPNLPMESWHVLRPKSSLFFLPTLILWSLYGSFFSSHVEDGVGLLVLLHFPQLGDASTAAGSAGAVDTDTAEAGATASCSIPWCLVKIRTPAACRRNISTLPNKRLLKGFDSGTWLPLNYFPYINPDAPCMG